MTAPVWKHKPKDNTCYVRKPSPEQVPVDQQAIADYRDAWTTWLATTPGTEAAVAWARRVREMERTGVGALVVVPDAGDDD